MTPKIILNTGSIPSDGQWHSFEWVNDTGQTIFIRKTYLWIGIDKGRVCDAHLQVRDARYPDPIDIYQWDHYADPIQPTGRWTYHEPPFALAAGRSLIMDYFSSLGTPGNHHFYVLIHFTD